MFFKGIHVTKKPIKKTIEEAECSVSFEINYNFSIENAINKIDRPWVFNSFWSIGLADPFPDESTLLD